MDSEIPTGEYTLKSSQDWPAWFTEFKFHAITKLIWDEVDPDSSNQSQNIYLGGPTPPETATTIEATPQGSALEFYKQQLVEYQHEQTKWKSKIARIQHLWNWVMSTVDKGLLSPIMMGMIEDKKPTLQKLVRALKEDLEPTAISTISLVRSQYRSHLEKAKQGRQSPALWFKEWTILYGRARSYKLPEVEGMLAAQDFLDALSHKYSPTWARSMNQSIVQSAALGTSILDLKQISKVYSALLQEQEHRSTNHSPGIFYTGESSDTKGDQDKNTEPCPCNIQHKWKPKGCHKLKCAVTGYPKVLSEEDRQKIQKRLQEPRFAKLRSSMNKWGWSKKPRSSGPANQQSSDNTEVAKTSKTVTFPGAITATIIDPKLLRNIQSAGMFSTTDFDAHPLSNSTILDGGGALHLVNSKDLLVKGSYEKSTSLFCVEAGTQSYPIDGYGTRIIKGALNGENGKGTEDLIMHNVALVEGFHVNIVSEARLHQAGLWYLGYDCTLRVGTPENSLLMASLHRQHNLIFIEYNPLSFYTISMNVNEDKRKLKSWRTYPRADSEDLWHARSGHLGPVALQALVKNAQNVRIKGTKRVKCEHCATTHASQVISRRPKERSPRPYWRIAWDLFDMPQGRLGELWILVIKCEYSGKLHTYNLQGKTAIEILRVFENFTAYIKTQYNLKICKIMQDNDPATMPWRGTSKFQQWAKDEGIDLESSPPYTHEPNGGAERAGKELITKSIKMRIGANLPTKLWPEIVSAATWLYNMSPSYAHNMRSPNEELQLWYRQYFKYYQPEHVRKRTADLRPDWNGVFAYGCRAYPLNKDRSANRDRKGFKVIPRGHIGYLVGYRSSNIYRIWIPTLDEVITTRNVTFDEQLFFEGEELEPPKEQVKWVVEILHEDEIRDAGEIFESVYDDLYEPAHGNENLSIQNTETQPAQELGGELLVPAQLLDGQPEAQAIRGTAPVRGASLAGKLPGNRAERTEQTGLFSPELTPEPGHQDLEIDQGGNLSSSSRQMHQTGGASPQEDSNLVSHEPPEVEHLTAAPRPDSEHPTVSDEAVPPQQMLEPELGTAPTRSSRRLRRQPPEYDLGGGRNSGAHNLLYGRNNFRGFHELPPNLDGLTTIHSVIAAALVEPRNPPRRSHRDKLPPPPERWKDLYSHQYRDLFLQAAQAEIDGLIATRTWEVIDRSEANTAPLPLKWVFTYKVDQDGYLIKAKARIVVRGDLQITDSIESTYATTLAARSFRTAIAIAAKFDLEIDQYDVVGAFLNASREHQPTVICDLPEGYRQAGKCVKLNRALYGLKDSPLLWYEEFSSTLKKAGLFASAEEPCLFFSRERRILLIFYVDDILVFYHKQNIEESRKIVLAIKAKYKIEDKGTAQWFLGVRIIRDRNKRTITLAHDEYIDKITKKFDLANTGTFPPTPLPSAELKKSTNEATKQEIKRYQERVGSILYTAIMLRPDVAFAASKLSHFLTNPSKEHFAAADRVIVYLYRTRYEAIQYGQYKDSALVICGDASFADDEDTRRSSHGYVIMLFGGPIIWKAARQNTVTTSTTEAELLALEHVSKESMALKRLFKELQLDLGTAWQIFCDNQQTIRLVVGKNERITTRLRHVDIQNMWLRQEHAKGSFQVSYLPTNSMPADGLTKNLSQQKFESFKEQLNLQDKSTVIKDSMN